MPTLTHKIAPLLTGLRQASKPGLPSLKLIARARDRASSAEDEHIPPLLPRLVVPMCDTTQESVAYNRYFEQGQFLSRQENWAELGKLIRNFDTQRTMTPGGTMVSEILAAGARSDAVTSAIAAVENYDPNGAQLPMNALEEVLEDHSEDHGVAVVVALAHVDIGWAWRRDTWGLPMDTLEKGAFHSHFRAASKILDRFDAFELDAPTLALARCAVLAAERSPGRRIADDYEDFMDLHPTNANAMRAFGRDLLPRWFGTLDRLEQEARQTMARTSDHWGCGGYSWVYMGALQHDPDAYDQVDTELFIDGLHDIIERCPDQHTVNVLAAFCGSVPTYAAAPGSAQSEIADCLDWIIQDHLREVHPLVWMAPDTAVQHPKPLPVGRDCQRDGRVRALSTLSAHFSQQISAGNRVVFDQSGLSIAPVS